MNTPPQPRRFDPWPVSIITFFAVAITGAVTFVVFCSRHPTDLVTSDYYEQELRYQQQMDRMDRAGQLTTRLGIAHDPATRRITITLPAEHAALQPNGVIHLYRPSAAGLDRRLPLDMDATGRQTVDARELDPGLWRVRVTWNANGQEFYEETKLVIARRGT